MRVENADVPVAIMVTGVIPTPEISRPWGGAPSSSILSALSSG